MSWLLWGLFGVGMLALLYFGVVYWLSRMKVDMQP